MTSVEEMIKVATAYRVQTTTHFVGEEYAFLQAAERENALYDVAELFHENSKIVTSKAGSMGVSVNRFFQPDIQGLLGRANPSYATAERIPLPRKAPKLKRALGDVIHGRSSIRAFTGAPLELDGLGGLLYHSYGINRTALVVDALSQEEKRLVHRSSPSGGGLYPCELYILAISVDGLAPGLYHYAAWDHSLELVKPDDDALGSVKGFLRLGPEGGEMGGFSAVVLVSCSFWRSRSKYGARGYRFCLQDSGHLGQNIWLAAEGLGLGACAIGGFFDNAVNDYVGLDGVDEAIVHAFVVGAPDKKRSVVYETVAPGAIGKFFEEAD